MKKIAELEHIAYYLGAKRCVIRIEEENTEENYDYSKREAKENVRYKSVTVSAEETLEHSLSNRSTSSRAGETVAEFEGSDTPRVPNLKWEISFLLRLKSRQQKKIEVVYFSQLNFNNNT